MRLHKYRNYFCTLVVDNTIGYFISGLVKVYTALTIYQTSKNKLIRDCGRILPLILNEFK